MSSRYRVAYEYPDGDLAIVRRSDDGSPLQVSVKVWLDSSLVPHLEFTTTGNPRYDARVARVAYLHSLQKAGANTDQRFSLSRWYRRTDLPGHVHYTER